MSPHKFVSKIAYGLVCICDLCGVLVGASENSVEDE